MVRPFIEFHKSLDDALSTIESPITKHFLYRGIQLLPGQTDAYVQATDHILGIELEDWEVYCVVLCTGVKTNITANFQVFANFVDTNGMPQIIWQLKDLPDFGHPLVYLEVHQLLGETFYTTPFQITASGSEFTARYDYKEKKSEYYQSIQLVTWFKQKLNRDELTTYYEISTKNTVSVTIKPKSIERWFTGILNNELMMKIRDMFNVKYKYINKRRFSLFEAFEVPDVAVDSNFNQTPFLLSIDYKEILTENPNEMSIITDIEEIKAILKPIIDMNTPLVFLRPANEIPPGYVEWTGSEGMFLIQRKAGDPDFGTLLNTGGTKTKTLNLTEIPSHNHGERVDSDGGDNVPVVRNEAGAVTGLRIQTDPSQTSSRLQVFTDSVGGGQAFSLLNPYRIVNFIIWQGI